MVRRQRWQIEQQRMSELMKGIDDSLQNIGLKRGKDVSAIPIQKVMGKGLRTTVLSKELRISPLRPLSGSERRSILGKFLGEQGWAVTIKENE